MNRLRCISLPLLVPTRTLICQSHPQILPSNEPLLLSQQSLVISHLVLNHSGPTRTLTESLKNSPAVPNWTQPLVDAVLKRLWNHGPKALKFFESISYLPNYAHSPSSFDLVIDISARMRDYKSVWSLLARRKQKGLSPSPRTFSIISERFASVGKPHRAVRVFLSSHHYCCPQSLASFNAILDVLCKSKRVEMASTLFRTFKWKFAPDVITYNTIANGWCIVKNTSKAMEVLKEMVEAGLSPSVTTYNLLLHGFFHAGQVKQGFKFFNQMKERGGDASPDVVTYTTVIHGLGVSGDVDKAKRVFEMMIVDGCLPSVATYNALIQVLCKKDNVESAIKVFDEMVVKGYVPNVTTYNVVIRGLCHVEKFDRAMCFMDRMKGDDGCEPNVQTYNVLIRYLCEAGEVEKSLQIFRKMGDEGCLPNLDTYNILVSGLFRTKKAELMVEAGKLLMEMVERGFLPRRFIFNRVLNGLLLTGNQKFAKEILRAQSRCGRLPRKIRL